MTMNEFNSLCNRYTISPEVALENDSVVGLLLDIRNAGSDSAKSGYRNCLIQVLENQF